MSTRWIPAARTDLGLTAGDLPTDSIEVTNRAWYLLRQFVAGAGGRSVEQMAGCDIYIPVALANHWGAVITGAPAGEWLQIGAFNGTAVVAAGITHTSTAGYYLDTHELTPLADTPLYRWLIGIGLQLATTASGLVITATPIKENRMSVNLSKGGKLDLTKAAGGTLHKVRIALGWDARKTAGDEFDLDAAAIGLGADGFCVGQKVIDPKRGDVGKEWFVYYNHLASPGNAIVHQGDNLTGTGTGDDEQILIDLDALPAEIVDIRFVVTIHQARARKNQSFAAVENAFIRVIDEATGTELSRYDLSEDTEAGVNALVFAKLYRHNGAWVFKAIGDGFTDELDGLVTAYKVG